MSAENVELVRRSYDAFNRRDWRALNELMDPDVEVESRLVAMEGGYRGEEGLRSWREAIIGFLPDYTVECEEIRDLGDITLARSGGTGAGRAGHSPGPER